MARRHELLAAFLGVLALGLSACPLPANAQDPDDDPPATGSLLDPGQVVVTGFPGTILADSQQGEAGDAARIDDTFIDPDGAVMRIIDIGGLEPGDASGGEPAEAFALPARDIGQVFGIAIDEALNAATGKPAPNIYLGASSAYGLHIVVPDRDGDGWPKRVETGDAEATYMEGQFGTQKGGGPGTIWKIDGVTGEVAIFADVRDRGEPNSGPGLGNLAYDPKLDVLYASDLDTGFIHAFDANGAEVGIYDHGAAGRAAAGLPAFDDDPDNRADITTESFKSNDPTTWGYAEPPRRVLGIKTHDGRLFYAVAEGPEIWSVAIGDGGRFDEPRREIALPTDAEPYEVADIAFTAAGWMILAQRPPVTGGYDYVTPVASGPARVLRYRPADDGRGWVEAPDEYAVGLRDDNRNAAGGLALGYGYKSGGGLDYGRCEATLWATGESLLQQASRAIKVEKVPGFATSAIDGLQGTDIGLVRPENVPPERARFVDYDGRFVDNGYRGYLGDAEIPYHCAGDAGERWEPEFEVPYWSTGYDDEPAPELDLAVRKTAVGGCKPGGLCRFVIRVRNRGSAVYYGPVVLADVLSTNATTLISFGPAPWTCAQSGAFVSCRRPPIYLKPGRSLAVAMTVRLAGAYPEETLGNCAVLTWLADASEADRITAVAMELARRGYYFGAADGVLTPELSAAIEAFEIDSGLSPTAAIARPLIVALFGRGAWRSGDADPANDRGCATHTIDPLAFEILPYVAAISDKPFVPPTFYPRPRRCEIGYFRRGDTCLRWCPPGTVPSGGRCLFVASEETRCHGGKVLVGRDRCLCPAGSREIVTGLRSRCVRIRPPLCYGGRLDGATCACPAGSERLKVGRRSYLCLPVRVTCIDGKTQGKRCVCPLNRYLVELARNRFQCVPRQVKDPVCDGGFANVGTCICPDGADPRRLAPGFFRCGSGADVTCIGGKADGDDCQCLGNARPVRIERNIFECRGGGGLKCIGGVADKGQCICRRGARPVRLDDRVFRCQPIVDQGPSDAVIRCERGEVVNGACVCSQGFAAVRVRPNHFRCTPKTSPGDDVGQGGDAGPAITCDGGKVSAGRCVCRRDERVERLTKTDFRCREIEASPEIVCEGGDVKGDRCLCGAGLRIEQTAKRAFRCIKRGGDDVGQGGGEVPTVTCDGGALKGNRCVCGEGLRVEQTAKRAFRCVKRGGDDVGQGDGEVPTVTCDGGALKGNRCVCGEGLRVEQTAKRAFRCVKRGGDDVGQGDGNQGGGEVPTVTCDGGALKGNRCVCGEGLRVEQTAKRAFRCVKRGGDDVGQGGNQGGDQQPGITCDGGTARGNRCLCGKGLRVEQTAKRAFRCVKRGGDDVGQGGGNQGGDLGGGKQDGTDAGKGQVKVCGQGEIKVGRNCVRLNPKLLQQLQKQQKAP